MLPGYFSVFTWARGVEYQKKQLGEENEEEGRKKTTTK